MNKLYILLLACSSVYCTESIQRTAPLDTAIATSLSAEEKVEHAKAELKRLDQELQEKAAAIEQNESLSRHQKNMEKEWIKITQSEKRLELLRLCNDKKAWEFEIYKIAEIYNVCTACLADINTTHAIQQLRNDEFTANITEFALKQCPPYMQHLKNILQREAASGFSKQAE